MDFSKCYEILSSRGHNAEDATCPCCMMGEESLSRLRRDIESEAKERHTLSAHSPLQLLEDFSALQTKRIEVYRVFDEELEALLQAEALSQYPLLCEKVTALFASISEKVIEIKEESKRRPLPSLAQTIELIQVAEKEKLTLVAARHLDRMRGELHSLNAVAGGVDDHQQRYLAEQMATVLQRIADLMEEIQAIKIDFIEDQDQSSHL
eukprot:gene7506-8303_t